MRRLRDNHHLFAVGQVDRRLQDDMRGRLERVRDPVCSKINAGIRSGDEVDDDQAREFAPWRAPVDPVRYRAAEVRR